MKKMISYFLVFALFVCLTACGNSGTDLDNAPPESPPASEPELEQNQNPQDVPEDQTPTEPETPTEPDEGGQEGSSALVAYFSCTGNTEAVAEYIAKAMDAELYEIVPEEPYTDADLNYNDDDSRASREMDDSSARPAISGEVENMDGYDVIFLGYPIWWGQAPRIISTFLESYDFAGKTIVPFCTSSSSSIGQSAENLRQLCDDTATWLDGSRFSGSVSESTVLSWLEELNLPLAD